VDNWDSQLARVQTQATYAMPSGEPESSPQFSQMDARIERMQELWATLRNLRLDLLEMTRELMAAISLETDEDRWAVLQNRPRTSDPEDGNYFGLLAALDAGWQVEPPVYARSRWGSQHAGQQMYHFILKRGSSITMISVADTPRLREFLDEQRIAINRN
jgi:hypothetical protein